MFRVVSPPIIRSTQLYLQYLVLVKPLLLPAAIVEELELQPHQNRYTQFPHQTQTSSNSSTIAADSSNGLTSSRYCKYSCVCSWWWVEIPPETCRAVFKKWINCTKVASCWKCIKMNILTVHGPLNIKFVLQFFSFVSSLTVYSDITKNHHIIHQVIYIIFILHIWYFLSWPTVSWQIV